MREKNKNALNMKIMTIAATGTIFLCSCSLSLAATNPNYGTTTFFSSKKEKPVLEKPILGAADNSNSHDDSDNDNDDDDDNEDGGGIVNPNDIFDNIGNTINSVVENSINVFGDTKRSLFDMQSDFDSYDFSDGEDGGEEVFIAGPRGESPEYMAALKDSDNRMIEFDFDDSNLKVAPKKSKLLFTNKEIAIDMTSQYVSIALIFLIAAGSAVGYYYIKKGASKDNEEDYD